MQVESKILAKHKLVATGRGYSHSNRKVNKSVGKKCKRREAANDEVLSSAVANAAVVVAARRCGVAGLCKVRGRHIGYGSVRRQAILTCLAVVERQCKTPTTTVTQGGQRHRLRAMTLAFTGASETQVQAAFDARVLHTQVR